MSTPTSWSVTRQTVIGVTPHFLATEVEFVAARASLLEEFTLQSAAAEARGDENARVEADAGFEDLSDLHQPNSYHWNIHGVGFYWLQPNSPEDFAWYSG